MYCNSAKRQFKCNLDIKLRDQMILQVTEFKYSRSIIQQDDEIDDDVNHRIQVGWYKRRKTTEILAIGK